MRSSDLVTPISSSDWDQVELSISDGSLDSDLDFFCELKSNGDMSLFVSNSDDSFESGSLSSSGLLLDGSDLHDLIFEFLSDDSVDDLLFLDGDGEEIDLLKSGNLSGLNESSKLGDGNPFLLVLLSSSWGSSSSSWSSSSSSESSSFFSRAATEWP